MVPRHCGFCCGSLFGRGDTCHVVAATCRRSFASVVATRRTQHGKSLFFSPHRSRPPRCIPEIEALQIEARAAGPLGALISASDALPEPHPSAFLTSLRFCSRSLCQGVRTKTVKRAARVIIEKYAAAGSERTLRAQAGTPPALGDVRWQRHAELKHQAALRDAGSSKEGGAC